MPPKPDWLKKKIINSIKRKQVEKDLAEASQAKKSKQHQPGQHDVCCLTLLPASLQTHSAFHKDFIELFYCVEKDTQPSLLDDEGPTTVASTSSSSSSSSSSERKLPYLTCETVTPNMICWTMTTLSSLTVESLLPTGVLVVNCSDFLQAVLKTADGVTFPEATALIQSLLTPPSSSSSCTLSSPQRIIIAFVDISSALCRIQRKLTSLAETQTQPQKPITNLQFLFEEACIYLTMEYGWEIVRLSKYNELVDYLSRLTALFDRSQSTTTRRIDQPYVMKLAKEKSKEALSKEEGEKHQLEQTWSVILQQLPLMSKERAMALRSESAFSCPRR
eukprot:scaffold4867_cov161-Ochromonas_danica.AAC.9